MKISELLKQDKVTLSFEVFPPKTSSSYESVARATQEIAALRPDFMSVTYGAGGGTSEHTVNIAADLRKKYDVTVLTHLTCVSSTREHVAKMVQKYKENGIENILALRGDIPEGGAPHSDYHYAAELDARHQVAGRLLHRRRMLSGGSCRGGEQDRGHSGI